MKHLHISSLVAAAALACSMSAQASDGTINFSGQLIASTCVVSAASAAQTVTLPTLATTALTAAGATAGKTAFSIAVTGCSAGTTTAAAYFEPGPTVNSTTGRLINGGAATNVELRLTNASDYSTIDLSKTGSATAQNSLAASVAAGAATANYYAEYYATGATTAGLVSSSVTYSMVYN